MNGEDHVDETQYQQRCIEAQLGDVEKVPSYIAVLAALQVKILEAGEAPQEHTGDEDENGLLKTQR